MQASNRKPIIIDAENLILGRMASIIAKRLTQGETITVVNAEKAILSGKKKSRLREAREYLQVGHPKKGPFHRRRPDRIVRRAVRGMLPYKKPKGKGAYKRLTVFIKIPRELQNRKIETLKEAEAKKLTGSYFALGELAREIGWNFGE